MFSLTVLFCIEVSWDHKMLHNRWAFVVLFNLSVQSGGEWVSVVSQEPCADDTAAKQLGTRVHSGHRRGVAISHPKGKESQGSWESLKLWCNLRWPRAHRCHWPDSLGVLLDPQPTLTSYMPAFVSNAGVIWVGVFIQPLKMATWPQNFTLPEIFTLAENEMFKKGGCYVHYSVLRCECW